MTVYLTVALTNGFPAGDFISASYILEYLPAGRSERTKALHLRPATTLSVAAVLIAVAINL